jgi:hypothetical protein
MAGQRVAADLDALLGGALDVEPSIRPPSVVSLSVWAITSKLATSGAGLSVTVRQTPSQDTLAPMASSSSKPWGNFRCKVCRPSRASMLSTRATPWTMPVNISAPPSLRRTRRA